MIVYSKPSRIVVASVSTLLSKSGSLFRSPPCLHEADGIIGDPVLQLTSSVQNVTCAFRKAYMSATPSQKFPSFVFKMVPLSV